MPLSQQSEKIKMLNQTVSDLQAQLIAKDKQIAFLQGQIYNFQWIIKNGDASSGVGFSGWDDDFGDENDYGDDFIGT